MTTADLATLPLPAFRARADGTIVYVNDAWRAQMDVGPGQPWLPAFEDLGEADAATLWRRCADADGALCLQSRVRARGREPQWYEIHLQRSSEAEATTGLLVNVTPQTMALAETHAILDTAVDAIIIIDEQGTIESFNQAATRMFGHDPEQVLGRNVSLLMDEPYRSQHHLYLRRYLDSGDPRIIGFGRELEALHADGHSFPIYLAVSEIDITDRRRFTGIVRDLSEQRASREALAEQREKLAHVGRLSTMGEMTASIAHEINQPLTAISMYAQAGLKLLDHGGDLTKLQGALEKLNVQALRAGAVIERIQRFARAQEGVRQFVNVNELIRDLLKLAETDARLHDIELSLELDEHLTRQPPDFYADAIQIQQVILNLIRNAIDAMNEIDCRYGRRILIRSSLLEGERVEVSVADLGPGVAESEVDLLFTPFHTTKKEGMGMGLSICRSIITDHGGELDYFDNEGPGATFYFRLPLDNTDA